MLKKFIDKSKDKQYQIILELIKEIETICINIRDKNGNLNYDDTVEMQNLPVTIDYITKLIYSSKLSKEFKQLLISEVNFKLQLIQKNKTR